MAVGKDNQVLKKITRQIYKEREYFPEELLSNFRLERVNDGNFGDLWFMTRGCRHDISGGCTMCNYGKGHRASEQKVLESIKDTLSEMPTDYEEFVISPVGNILDPLEVSDDMLSGLGESFAHLSCKTLITESRADLITAEGLKRLKRTFHAECQCVELGLESCDDWILRNCVNKGMASEDYKKAIRSIRDAGMYAIANIGLGIPFMNEKTAVAHTLESVYKALEWGAGSIVLFPYHVKPGTLTAWLYEHDEYAPVSLWSLVEVLNRLEPEAQRVTRISWYKDYYTEPWRIMASPYTCESCYTNVISMLEEYKNSMSRGILKSLSSYSCKCREDWREKIEGQEAGIDVSEMERQYRKMAEAFHIAPDLLEEELKHMKHTRGYGRCCTIS